MFLSVAAYRCTEPGDYENEESECGDHGDCQRLLRRQGRQPRSRGSVFLRLRGNRKRNGAETGIQHRAID